MRPARPRPRSLQQGYTYTGQLRAASYPRAPRSIAPRPAPPREGRRLLLLWIGAGLAVFGGHVAVALALMSRTDIAISAGEPPAAIMVDLDPIATASEDAGTTASSEPPQEIAARDTRERAPQADGATASLEAADPQAQPAQAPLAAAVPLPVPRPKVPPRPKTAEQSLAAAPLPPVAEPPEADAASAPVASTAASPSAHFGASSAASQLSSSWKSRLLAHLDRFKSYPEAARQQRQEGTALLSFNMDRAGNVLDYFLARSSGMPELDREVIAMIRRATPLPGLPPEVAQNTLRLVVPVRFSVNQR